MPPVALSSEAWVTVAEFKEYLRDLDPDDRADDDFIRRILNSVTAAIQRFCRRKFSAASVVDEPHDGNGSRLLRLDRPPINSITKLVVKSDSYTYELVADRDYVFTSMDTAAMVHLKPHSGTQVLIDCFPVGRANVLATYNGGFASIPDDVKLATLIAAMSEWPGRGRDPRGRERSGGGFSQSREQVGVSGLPVEVERRLQPYRIMLMASVQGRVPGRRSGSYRGEVY